jgi:hypothetical protein
MTETKFHRFAEAYLKMASEARYRPPRPATAWATIQLSLEECQDQGRLRQEARDYALRFNAEEDKSEFWIGCSDYRTNRAFVWAIEAARCLASGDSGNATALKLLKMAAADVVRSMKEDRERRRQSR